MPNKNIVKTYVEGGIYHAYNRGANKEPIFRDAGDYVVLLGILKKYLSPTTVTYDPLTGKKTLVENRLYVGDEVSLMTYCLMPNHYHFIIKQESIDGMTELLRKVFTSYSVYFNKKYKRVGSLFQGVYKASNVINQKYLMHLSAYIHLNPVKDGLVSSVDGWKWSSYEYLIGVKKAKWLKSNELLELCSEGISLINYKVALREYTELELKNSEDSYLPQNILIEELS